MNLTKLFELQAQLDADIMAKHPAQEGEDRFGKKVLALLVELGELANEWRGFKFWSNDQQARTAANVECFACDGTGDANYEMVQEDAEGSGDHEYIECEDCDSTGIAGTYNPLLEEYVDVLHFALSIGNDLGVQNEEIKPEKYEGCEQVKAIVKQFAIIFNTVSETGYENANVDALKVWWEDIIGDVLGLGEMLGFTWEQIEQAYYDKNKENFARQARGY